MEAAASNNTVSPGRRTKVMLLGLAILALAAYFGYVVFRVAREHSGRRKEEIKKGSQNPANALASRASGFTSIWVQSFYGSGCPSPVVRNYQ